MNIAGLPNRIRDILLKDAIQRDRTTARRACLLAVLWGERFLTKSHLVARVEGELGRGCFGESSWEDTFYRDMRMVKQALSVAGFRLVYSRRSSQPGYYLSGQPDIEPSLSATLHGSISEVDAAQIRIFCRMSHQQRILKGFSISDTAREVVAYRIRERNPTLSLADAKRLALQVRGTP